MYNMSMTHSRHDLLKARLKVVRNDLDPIVERLTPETLTWAPVEGMRTMAGQIVEIVSTEIQLVTLLKEDYWITDDQALENIQGAESVDLLTQALTKVRRQTLEYLDSLSEADLAEEVSFGGGWFGSLG